MALHALEAAVTPDMQMFETEAAAINWLSAEATRAHPIPIRTPMSKVGISKLDAAGCSTGGERDRINPCFRCKPPLIRNIT
jgi:hypothetical protein